MGYSSKMRSIWGGNREYFYFQTEVVIPKEWRNCKVVYELRTGREGEWEQSIRSFMPI